jgi:hypothetical protein
LCYCRVAGVEEIDPEGRCVDQKTAKDNEWGEVREKILSKDKIEDKATRRQKINGGGELKQGNIHG